MLKFVMAAVLLAPPTFESFGLPPITVEFTENVQKSPFTGRLFVVASTSSLSSESAPRQNWFKPTPFFAQDVKAWQPGSPRAFEPNVWFPRLPKKIGEGKIYLQAVLDRDLGEQNALAATGNAFSVPVVFDATNPTPITLKIDRLQKEKTFTEKERVKYFELESSLLSKFHGKPTRMRAGVVLPASFEKDPQRKYPIVYEIPGFGGTYFMAFNAETRKATDLAGVEAIHVTLDATCRTGHHVFADSANNGPVGKALITEFIPALEKRFRGQSIASTRFVTGHSSGGWSSLWLQVTHPEFFGGVWSTAPDPVDFRDFQKVDIYQQGINLFVDGMGKDRPLARVQGKVMLHYRPFSDMEHALGRGGQLQSFEAVFSPKGTDGQPRKLWDRKTGTVDHEVAKAWEKYDIRLILERNWPTLQPKLAGKIHVYMGAEDTFYLDGATRFLKASLEKLGSDAIVEIFPGKDHGNLLDAKMRERIAREMGDTARKAAAH